MNRQAELKKLRDEARAIDAKIEEVQSKDWYDSGCTIDEDDQWEESARHWADEGDWEDSGC